MAQDRPLEIKDIAFTGKLISSVRSPMVGENFTQLVNMRYNDVSIEMVGGMTKINSTALSTYLKVRSGSHYRKAQPAESHVLVQAYNTGLTASQVLQNTTAVPSAGDFSATALHTDSSGAGTGRFSIAPNGEVAYCNGVDTLIWPGDEQRISGFYNFNPDNSFSYEFTEEVQNTLTTDYATVANSGGGIDSNTSLLLHLDNDATDATTTHTPVPTNITYSTTTVFGTHSAVFNGTTAYITVPDNAEFDFSGGNFTIEARIRVDSLATQNPIYHHALNMTALPFDSGEEQPSVDDELEGNVGTPGGGGIVHWSPDDADLDSGTWAGTDAAGTLYLTSPVAGLANNEQVNNNTTTTNDVMTVDGTVTADDSEEHFTCFIDTDGSIKMQLVAPYETEFAISTAAGIISVDTWYHIAFVESGDYFYIFVNGQLRGSGSSTERCPDMDQDVTIGFDDSTSTYFDGYMDEFRVSDTARWTSNFTPPDAAYSATGSYAYFYLGSIRPLDGIKYYIGTANTATSTMITQYWDGDSWATVSNQSDGTTSGGVSLAQTGWVTFDDTISTAKLKYLNQTYIYWYRIYLDDCDTTTTIYNVTASAGMNTIKDIWDGQLRTCYSWQIYDGSAWTDHTINVKEEDFTEANEYSASYFSSAGNPFTAGTKYLVAGFSEKQSGILFTMAGSNVNKTSAVAIIYYWSGSAWVSVGTIDDLTSENGATLAKSGTMTWTPPEIEHKLSTLRGNVANESTSFFSGDTVGSSALSKGYSLYYYKIEFSATLSSGDVKIDQVKGITAQTDLAGYKFPLNSGDRLWLCSEQSDQKNSALVSAYGTSVVFNGDDARRFYFGDETELTCGTSIYSQFGSSLYDITIICKATETWIVTGNGPESWNKFKASDRIGCPAPSTMVTGHMDVDITPGLNRYVAIWQATDGIYIFDGRTFFPIHKDIEDVFDKRNTSGINRSKIGDSVGFFDNDNKEYHWLWASGTSTTLNEEYVFDLKRMKWYTMVRTGDLQYGMEVYDTSGNQYNYGFLDTGYMERLEYGNDSDGSAITAIWQTGDIFLAGSPLLESTIRIAKLVMNGKSVTSNNVTLYHYGDGSSTETISRSLSPSGSSFVMPLKTEGLGPYTTHKFKGTITTNDEVIGFEPLILSVAFKRIRIDKN